MRKKSNIDYEALSYEDMATFLFHGRSAVKEIVLDLIAQISVFDEIAHTWHVGIVPPKIKAVMRHPIPPEAPMRILERWFDLHKMTIKKVNYDPSTCVVTLTLH